MSRPTMTLRNGSFLRTTGCSWAAWCVRYETPLPPALNVQQPANRTSLNRTKLTPLQRYESSATARVNLMPPTGAQIARILAPLQTHRERNLSARMRGRHPCAWLRTSYGGRDSDAAHARLLAAVGHQALLARLRGAEALLDDALLYAYPDGAWPADVFQRLPCLLAGEPDRASIQRAKKEAVRDTEYDVDVYSENAGGTGGGLEAGAGAGEVEPDWGYVQVLSQVGFLLVADAAALRPGGRVLLAWYDDCGRLVRQARVEPARVVDVFQGHRSGWLYDVGSRLWREAEIGPAYRRGGQCGPPRDAAADEYWESDEDAEIY